MRFKKKKTGWRSIKSDGRPILPQAILYGMTPSQLFKLEVGDVLCDKDLHYVVASKPKNGQTGRLVLEFFCAETGSGIELPFWYVQLLRKVSGG